MKLTKSQLKKIIKEEIGRLFEQETGEFGFNLDDGEYTHPLAIRGASSAEIVEDADGNPSILMIDGKIKIHTWSTWTSPTSWMPSAKNGTDLGVGENEETK